MQKLLIELNRILQYNNLSANLKGRILSLKEEIEVYELFKKNKNYNLKKAQELNKKIKFIQLGCGNHIISNCINIDLCANSDIQWDIREGLPFCDDSIERVFSEHVFEHLEYPEPVGNVLREAYRVLKEGGKIIIGVPDCDVPIKAVYENDNEIIQQAKLKWYNSRTDVKDNMKTNIDYLNYVMRDQLFNEKYHPHYWGYNEENLTLLLTQNGFKNVKKWEVDKNIINPKREWGTLYLIAEK